MTALLGTALNAASDPPAAKQVQIILQIFRGDPLGSREDGTLKVYAEPKLVTLDGRPFNYQSGGEKLIDRGEGAGLVGITFGLSVQGKVKLLQKGQAFLDATFEFTPPPTERGGRTLVESTRTRSLGKIVLGEVVKIRLEGRPARDQVWVELKAEQLK